MLPKILDALAKMHGEPKPPRKDPYHLILHENAAYLADDEKREAAFRALDKKIGLRPEKILAASEAKLLEIAKMGGMHPEERADRLRAIAGLVVEEHGGDLGAALDREPKKARKFLKAFPAIGDPGADKILLFSRREPKLALESNGLRVLVRLGYAAEDKSYAKTYKAAITAASKEIKETIEARIRAHQLLRVHGQEVCKRSAPLCDRCMVSKHCAYAKAPAFER